MSDSKHISICPNCESPPGTGKYCQECGQKNKPLKLNLVTIFGEFFSIVFNLDNQLFRTIKAAAIPGKLATEFAKGKRKSYLHPLRFFFYSWIIFALILNFTFKPTVDAPSKKEQVLDRIITIMRDSTRTEMNKKALDSLQDELYNRDFNLTVGFGQDIHFVRDSSRLLPPSDTLITILYDDLKLSDDSLFHKYNITKKLEQFSIKRAKRFKDGFTDIFQYMMDHFIWLFFAIIPFSSLVLWLFYGRSKKYYVEHILYLLYLFSVLFIFFTLAVLLQYAPDWLNTFGIAILWIGLVAYSFMSMKKYYQQSFFKTFLKWNTYLFINFLLFSLFTILYTIISAALF